MQAVTKALAIMLTAAIPAVAASAQSQGDPAPDFTYAALGGGSVSLGDYQGKVLFVFLFGYQCPYCLSVGNRTEKEVHEAFASDTLFAAIGLDLWNGTPANVSAFRSQTGVTYKLGLQASSMSSLYGTTYDRVMVIGPDGTIAYKGLTATSGTLDEAVSVIASMLSASTSVSPDGSATTLHLSTYPNPSAGAVSVEIGTSESGDAALVVYDMLGRRVATLHDGWLPAGNATVVWDGMNESGARVGSGVYLVSLRSGGNSLTRTVIRSE